MKKMMTLSLAALMSTATLGVATPAAAQQGYYDGSYGTYYSGAVGAIAGRAIDKGNDGCRR